MWLSDGSSGEVGSFTEDICELYDHGLAGDAMNSGEMEKEFSADVCEGFRVLHKLIHDIPEYIGPQKIIDHPKMKSVRRLSEAILLSISVEGRADECVSAEIERLRSGGCLAPPSPAFSVYRYVRPCLAEAFSLLRLVIAILVILWILFILKDGFPGLG